MPTLVLPPRLNDDAKAIRSAALDYGWEVFQASRWQIPPGLKLNDPVLYSEPLFADVASAELKVFLLDPVIDWLVSVPEEYTHRRIKYATLQEASVLLDQPWFVKPAEDKSFPARVYLSASELPGEDQVPGNTPILLSEPVHWKLEVRCFVLDQQVVTLSPYFRDGGLAIDEAGNWRFQRDEEKQARLFAEKILTDARLCFPPAVVLDIGIIDDRGWAVVEINPAWGSGIYGCDPNNVLPVLQRATIPQGKKTPEEERQFMRPHITIER
jgi:hypothetical protein